MKLTITEGAGGGLERIEARVKQAAQGAPREAAKAVAKGALNIKDDWRRAWTGHSYAPALPYSVGYDLYPSLGGASAEIGPDKTKRQGALGSLFEYGSVNNAPIPGGLPALEAEQPRFEKAMEDIALKALDDL